MARGKTYIVRVPATTANIGSGFDTLGMSLGLYNVVQFVPDENVKLEDTMIDAEGEGVDQITTGLDNMIIKAMNVTASKAGRTLPGGSMYLINRIPFASNPISQTAQYTSQTMLQRNTAHQPAVHAIVAVVTHNENMTRRHRYCFVRLVLHRSVQV